MSGLTKTILDICMVAIVTGLFKMLVPENKYKKQLSFLVACIFSVCIINSAGRGLDMNELSFHFEEIPVMDYTSDVSEQVTSVVVSSVKSECEKILAENNVMYANIEVTANIDSSYSIFISEIRLVFDGNTSLAQANRAVDIIKSEVGDEIEISCIFEGDDAYTGVSAEG